MPDLPEKEILNKLFSEGDKIPILQTEVEPKLDKLDEEVKPLIQKLEEEIYLAKPVTDDYGQPLVSNPAPANPKITLPITQGQFAFGLTQRVTDSIRWLAEWCLRLMKILGPKTTFRQTETK